MDTYEKVKSLLAEQLTINPEKIAMESEIVADLGADSLDMVEMMMSMEEEFGITVDEDKAAELKTVADIVALIDSNN
ncbi:MAG: acyl carrier protein [Clostridiales bacterium]|nr:acyl carrier protein [Clostridiales bacterium]